MKRYAIADEVPEDCDYLTAGKEYETDRPQGDFAFITDDEKELLPIWIPECPHLDEMPWRIVEREQ